MFCRMGSDSRVTLRQDDPRVKLRDAWRCVPSPWFLRRMSSLSVIEILPWKMRFVPAILKRIGHNPRQAPGLEAGGS